MQPRPTRLLPAVLLGLVLGPPAVAGATVVESRTLEAQAREADSVVVGRVEAGRTVAVDGGRRLLTVLTVRVDEALKGTPGEEVEVVVPGGVQGDLMQRVVGLPVLEAGEEVALFLGRRPGRKARWALPGLGQAVYRIRGGAAVRQVDGLEVVTGPLDEARPPFPDVRLRLEELRQRVRAVAAPAGPRVEPGVPGSGAPPSPSRDTASAGEDR